MVSARGVTRAAVVAVMMLVAGALQAAITIDTVHVGDPGNAGKLSGAGAGAGSYGPSRICGAVDYEYNIGKYEVTATQYTTFLNAVAKTDTYGLYYAEMSRTDAGSGIVQSGGGTVGNPYTYSVATAFANRPVNFVDWGDAARFANWLHNGQPTGNQGVTTTEDGAYFLNGATSSEALLAVTRKADWKWAITSEDEWYKAAYYDPATSTYFDYPTSSNAAPGQDMADASGNNANHYTAPHAYPIDSGKYTTVVGEFQNSESPYGTFDQGGNLWEWDEAVMLGSYHGVRGGSFDIGYWDANMLAAFRYDYGFRDTAFEYVGPSGIGFRVVLVPEPATLSLLALAGLLALRRRR